MLLFDRKKHNENVKYLSTKYCNSPLALVAQNISPFKNDKIIERIVRSYPMVKLASYDLRNFLVVKDFLHNAGQQFSILMVVHAKCIKSTTA